LAGLSADAAELERRLRVELLDAAAALRVDMVHRVGRQKPLALNRLRRQDLVSGS
jgi:hypothetical protein